MQEAGEKQGLSKSWACRVHARAVKRLGREGSPWLSGSPRTRKFLANLFPRLLDAVAHTVNAAV